MVKVSVLEGFKDEITALHKQGKSCPDIMKHLKETHGIVTVRGNVHRFVKKLEQEHSKFVAPTVAEELAEMKRAMARQEQVHAEALAEIKQAMVRQEQIMNLLMEMIVSATRELRAAPVVKELPAAVVVEAVPVSKKPKSAKKSASPRRSTQTLPGQHEQSSNIDSALSNASVLKTKKRKNAKKRINVVISE